MEQLKDRIVYWRKKRGLAQQDVACRMGIERGNYAKYENGTRTPKEKGIRELANIFQCVPEALFLGEKLMLVEFLHTGLQDLLVRPDTSCVYENFSSYWEQFEVAKEFEADLQDILVQADILPKDECLFSIYERLKHEREELTAAQAPSPKASQWGEQAISQLQLISCAAIKEALDFLRQYPGKEALISQAKDFYDFHDRTNDDVYTHVTVRVFAPFADLLINSFSDSYHSNSRVIDMMLITCNPIEVPQR